VVFLTGTEDKQQKKTKPVNASPAVNLGFVCPNKLKST